MDRRRQLRGHWPPNKINSVTVTVDADTYRDLYMAARVGERSLADEVRGRLPRPATDMDGLITAFERWWAEELKNQTGTQPSYAARKTAAFRAFSAGWEEKR